MPIVVAQVSIPSAARPRFDLHVERFAVRCLVAGAQLLEKCGKGYIQRRLDVDFLVDRKCQVFESLFGGNHHFSLDFEFGEFNSGEAWRTIASARSLTRFNWC